jgi:DNA repair protein RadC
MEAAGAAALKAVQAIAMRLTRTALNSRPLLGNPERLLAYFTATIGRAEVEQVHVLYLDTRNRLIADEPQGRGTVNHAPIYPREVAKRALELQATALILARNHPSGDPTPSAADRAMTDEIVAAAQVFGIIVHDHIVVGQGRHLSFRRAGLLTRPAVAEPASRAPLPAAAE